VMQVVSLASLAGGATLRPPTDRARGPLPETGAGAAAGAAAVAADPGRGPLPLPLPQTEAVIRRPGPGPLPLSVVGCPRAEAGDRDRSAEVRRVQSTTPHHFPGSVPGRPENGRTNRARPLWMHKTVKDAQACGLSRFLRQRGENGPAQSRERQRSLRTMNHKSQQHPKPTSARSLDIYRVTLELVTTCRPLVARISRFNKRSGAQLVESLSSTLQNLSEGMRRIGKDRAHLLTVALGSCDEVRALLDAARAFGVVTATEQQDADELADRICAMGYRLQQKAR
jgi:four helix bundle protein